MFIAMNRFRVKKGSEHAFERVWLGRDTYLDRVPGFLEFYLLKGPEAESYALLAQRVAEQAGRRGVDQVGRISGRARACRQRDNWAALSGASEI
jgi:antibiotic biosynthesis monooxygenase